MFSHLTGQARRVMQLAHREALARNHDYVGSQHVLLALLQEGGSSSRILAACRARPEQILQELDEALQPSERVVDLEKLPLTVSCQRLLQWADVEAQATHQSEVGQEHLLLGLLRDEESEAAQMLSAHGVSLEGCRHEMLHHAPEENRDHLVRDSLPVLPMVSRDPTVAELEDRLSTEILPREWRPVVPRHPEAQIMAIEGQLRATQIVLGGVLGAFTMVELYGWQGLFSGVLIGLLIAALQNSFLGSLAGALAGFFVGFQHIHQGVWIVFVTTLLGFFLGSWLGNIWRFPVPMQTNPRDEDLD